ncbi:MAG: flagellar biosynthetic protein FliO [Armatimonadetes bacterium]|nr:flagellar biosynthetic protein FliO [Armatimonadota bacterium]
MEFGSLLAQVAGTKPDITLPNSSGFQAPGIGFSQIFQMILAVGIVIALIKFAVPKLAPALTKKFQSGSTAEIKVVESTNFAGGMLHLVTVRGKSILLGSNQQGIQMLADVTGDSKTEQVEEKAFFEMVDEAGRAAIPKSAVVRDPDSDPAPQIAIIEAEPGDEFELQRKQAMEALTRLNRLMG